MALNIETAKAFCYSEKTVTLAAEYLALKAKAQVIRQEVDAIYLPIFKKYTFLDDEGQVITDKELLYCCPDDDLTTAYYNECDAATQADSRFSVEPGKCPALVAEHQLSMKGVEIVKVMAEFMGVNEPYNVELRDQMIELFLQAAFAK